MKVMSEPVQVLLAQAHAAFSRKDWVLAHELWSSISANFDRHHYRIGDVALNASVSKRLAHLNEYVDRIGQYHAGRRRASREARPTIAVFTSIVGGYDSVKMPEMPDCRFDYFLYSEAPMSGGGLWEVLPVPAANCSDARAARYVKMHPHRLLIGYDIAVWVDSNVMVLGDIYPLLEEFLQAPEPVGAMQHPHRENIYQEVRECIRQKKDARRPMLEQTARYRSEGFVHDDLVEANVLMFKLTDARVHAFLDRWWAELERGSRRDQLAFNYALRQVGIDWHRLLERPMSARTHPAFAYVEHDQGTGIAHVLIDALGVPPRDPYLPLRHSRAARHAPCVRSPIAGIRALSATVILQMGRGDAAARECVEALLETRKAIPFEVTFVDPSALADLGPMAALNAALTAARADIIVLLEAGVRVAAGWLDKLAEVLWSTPGAGIVAPLVHMDRGPLEPAGRHRPSVLAALDAACERASAGVTPRVPAAGGVCLGLRRDVVARIGGLDHDAFPWQAGWDVDYCFRAADAGFDTVIATQTCIAMGARDPVDPGEVPRVRSAGETLARRHSGRRVSRAFMTLRQQPIIDRQRERMRIGTDEWIDVAMPRVFSLQRRRLHR